MITIITILLLIASVKLAGFFLKIFGKLLGLILGLAGFAIAGIVILSTAGVAVGFVALPIIAVVAIASLVKNRVSL